MGHLTKCPIILGEYQMALMQDKLNQAEYVRSVFAVTLPYGTPFDDIKNPAFWAHTAAKLHPTDRIEVVDEEGTYFAEVMVISCARNWAKVSILRFHELSESIPNAKDDASADIQDKLGEYTVDWTQNTRARVIRKSDREVIKENFASKADATKWLASYVINTAG
jgi:hypothetical protein